MFKQLLKTIFRKKYTYIEPSVEEKVALEKNFWSTLKKPIFVLAPMADVTDCAFREVIAECGKPHVFWTEFVSADGLCLAPEEAQKKLRKDLLYSEQERPIVAQLFGSNPLYMEKAAMIVKELGFDGIDINMGCPDRSIEKQGAGAGMIKNPKRAREIIRAAQKSGLPVSVKTRVGYNRDEMETWLPQILAERPAVLTIHARTRKEMSKVPAQWERVRRAVEIRNTMNAEAKENGLEGINTLILGNGDALHIEHGKELVEKTGCDGVMFGRAIFGNPWLFSSLHGKPTLDNVAVKDKLAMLVKHTQRFEDMLGDVKSFAIMKKHFKAYVNGFDGAKELRMKLMEATNAKEVAQIVDEFCAII